MNTRKRGSKGTRFLKRYVIPSDNHTFVGRVFDLSVVELYFDTYEELSKYTDVRYVFHVNYWLSSIIERVESLNRLANLFWPERQFISDLEIPISKYDWLNIGTDAFLMRLISVADCAIILTSEVYETGLQPKRCTIGNLKRAQVPAPTVDAIERMTESHRSLRIERNARFHHGMERELSSDDQIFKQAAIFEHRGSSLVGEDSHGRRIDTRRYLREGLVELQRQYNPACRKISKEVHNLYDLLSHEFERRFKPKFNHPKSGFGLMHRQI